MLCLGIMDEKPDFELYSPGIQPEDPDHILFLHIPVSRKS